jgi:hypothetical protein
MSIQISQTGTRQTFFSKPSDTNAATVYTASSGVVRAVLESVNIAATGAANATVWLNDGSTDWLLLDAKTLSANTNNVEIFGEPVLRSGHSIKVKTSSANNLTFTVTLIEELRPA